MSADLVRAFLDYNAGVCRARADYQRDPFAAARADAIHAAHCAYARGDISEATYLARRAEARRWT